MDLNPTEIFERRRRDQFKLYAQYVSDHRVRSAAQVGLDRQFVAGSGCYVFDRDGNRYLDCDAGNGVFTIGRNEPRVRQALAALLDAAPANWVARDTPLPAALLAEALIGHMPDGFGKVLFTNTGAETTEAAIKLARKVVGRPRVLFLKGDFHGLTYGALSVTDSDSRGALMDEGFAPLLPGCQALPWGDLQRLQDELAHGDVAALIVEPIQGATVRILDAGYLREAAASCRRHGCLLIDDEILTGLGRTGTFLACRHSDVVPDLVLLAKGLSGGVMPLGALLMSNEVSERLSRKQSVFVHASTFGENDYSMVAGLATLAVIEADGLSERAARCGSLLLDGLRSLQARHPMIAEVRGRGLLVGIQLRAPGGWLSHPAAMYLESRGLLGHLCLAAMATRPRVLVGAPTRNNVVRLQPPLCIDEDQVAAAVTAFDEVLNEAERFPDGAGRIAIGRLLGSLSHFV